MLGCGRAEAAAAFQDKMFVMAIHSAIAPQTASTGSTVSPSVKRVEARETYWNGMLGGSKFWKVAGVATITKREFPWKRGYLEIVGLAGSNSGRWPGMGGLTQRDRKSC